MAEFGALIAIERVQSMTTADWQSTPFTLPLLASGLLCGWVAYVGWCRREVPGAVPFVVLMAALAGWALVNLVEKSLVNYELRRAIALFDYVFIVPLPGAWLVFAARFSRLDRWLTRRLVPLLYIEPVLILLLALTNSYHGLIHAATRMRTDGPFAVMAITHGPVFYVSAAYSYLLFAAGATFLIAAMGRKRGRSSSRIAVVLAAMLVPVLGNVAYVCHLQPHRLTDLTPLYFAAPGLAAAWLLFRFRVFDVFPIARDFVLDCLNDAVFVLDSRFRILDANLAARSLLRDPGRLHKQCLAAALPEVGRYLPAQAGTGVSAAEVSLGPAGNVRSWDMHVLPLIDDGVTIGSVVRLTDVTERRRLQEELREQAEQLMEADERKDQFLAMLGHELRNPLAPISSALQILKKSVSSGPIVARAHQTLDRQLQQLVRLVDDLLDVSRITSGKIQLRTEPVELATVVATALETSRPLLDARKHDLTFSLPQEPVWLQADPIRLAQIFSNLLNNAAKYTDVGGHVWLTAQRQPAQVVVHVKDTGIGMTPEMLIRAFDLFAQDDRSRDRSHGGLGVGLTLVRELVQLHRGTIQVHSDGPGTGSEFVIELPVLPGPPRTRTAIPPEASASPARRVLVVDDNADAAEALASFLAMSGHETCTAHDGLEALEAARVHRPDVVLLDIGMPGMDGYELARRLRQEPNLEQLLVVALTGYGQDEDRRQSCEAGIDHHLVKPVDVDALQAVLAH
jgi:signal transduction histidine kinase